VSVVTELTAELSAIAVEAINDFGGTAVIDYELRGAVYNTATSQYSGGTQPQQATVKAIVEDKGLYLNGVVVGDKKIMVAAQGLTKPEPADKFTVGGHQYTIMDRGVVAIYCGDTPVIYEVYGTGNA
jgi:hypothetical protein